MKFNKSTKLVFAAIVLVTLGLVLTKCLFRSDKFLYHIVSTMSDPNLLVEHQVLDLNGRWFFSTTDSVEFATPGYNDSGWDTERFMYIALIKQSQSKIWMRKHFVAPDTLPEDSLFLRLSLGDNRGQVYVNGLKVQDSCFYYDKTVCCRFPSSYLIKGKGNVIAVHSQGLVVNSMNNVNRFKDEIFCIFKPTINLAGTWQFAKGSNTGWKEKSINDSVFKSIEVPKYWDEQGYKQHDGDAWYRKEFAAGLLKGKKALLFAGKIDDYNEIFINGKRIGGNISIRNETGAGTRGVFGQWVFYSIAPDILTDNNTIAIHVFDKQGRGGIYQGPVGLISVEDYLRFKHIQ